MGKIDDIIKKKGLVPTDCAYHTRQGLENGGKIRVLRIKGENINHVEYTCPKCGYEGYDELEHTEVSKASKIRFRVECAKCKTKIKIEKLKAKKAKKKK